MLKGFIMLICAYHISAYHTRSVYLASPFCHGQADNKFEHCKFVFLCIQYDRLHNHLYIDNRNIICVIIKYWQIYKQCTMFSYKRNKLKDRLLLHALPSSTCCRVVLRNQIVLHWLKGMDTRRRRAAINTRLCVSSKGAWSSCTHTHPLWCKQRVNNFQPEASMVYYYKSYKINKSVE